MLFHNARSLGALPRTRGVAVGAAPEQPLTDCPWGRLATFADPFGQGFCLVQFTGRGYDEIAG